MEFATPVSGLSFRQKPRRGQCEAIEEALRRAALNIHQPTGYGKSISNVGIYSALKHTGRVNRLLVVFPTVAQIDQFVNDGPGDLATVNVEGPRCVINIGYFDAVAALKAHRKNTAQVFATTIQCLAQAAGLATVNELMSSGLWMVTIDEYHHYGTDKLWGQVAKSLPAQFRLAMSATPYRPDCDSAFGPPDISVKYRDAVKEGAVKPLHGHSYIYRIDAMSPDGELRTYTTDQLVAEVGSDSPDAIEKFRVERQMRWSPKYVSPLVTIPIERMLRERIGTGYKLQVLVGALCVSHAELVCDQIRAIYPELSIDWVGTGQSGRSDAENRAVLSRFCPKKDANGVRNPELDVLVHVGLAGEGLDCRNVSEIIHLNKASINNSNNQEIGRAARRLGDVTGHVNFDSSSEYARKGYVGENIMDAMDFAAPQDRDPQPPDDEGGAKREIKELPDEPTIQIWNLTLEGVNSGDPEVLMYKEVAVEKGLCTREELLDPNSPIHDEMLQGYMNMRRREAEKHNAQAISAQWHEAVNLALSVVTGHVVTLMTSPGHRAEKTVAGDIKRRINGRKKYVLGAISKDPEVCRKHYQWLKEFERQILSSKRVPEWLA